VHERAFAGSDLSKVNVLCTVETRNREHFATTPPLTLKPHGIET
jgi:hypothetical protein